MAIRGQHARKVEVIYKHDGLKIINDEIISGDTMNVIVSEYRFMLTFASENTYFSVVSGKYDIEAVNYIFISYPINE